LWLCGPQQLYGDCNLRLLRPTTTKTLFGFAAGTDSAYWGGLRPPGALGLPVASPLARPANPGGMGDRRSGRGRRRVVSLGDGTLKVRWNPVTVFVVPRNHQVIRQGRTRPPRREINYQALTCADSHLLGALKRSAECEKAKHPAEGLGKSVSGLRMSGRLPRHACSVSASKTKALMRRLRPPAGRFSVRRVEDSPRV
jgi:hypothetical protein